VEVAAREFRLKGIHSTHLADVMAAAGLTHGAFYRHFRSKDQLVAEACAEGMGTLVNSTEAAATQGAASLFEFVKSFLSTKFHDNAFQACPLVTMGSELARADVDTRQAASDGLQDVISILVAQAPSSDKATATADALFQVSCMIGAVTLARIVPDRQFADQILEQVQTRLAKSSQLLAREQVAGEAGKANRTSKDVEPVA